MFQQNLVSKRIAPVAEWAEYIVKNTQDELKKYDRSEVEFAMYFPEVHLLNAAKEKHRTARSRLDARVFTEQTLQ